MLDGADIRSRLGCQVFLTKEVDGMVAKLPSATRNMYVDGEYFPSSSSHFVLYLLIRCSVSLRIEGGVRGTREMMRSKERLLMTRRQG